MPTHIAHAMDAITADTPLRHDMIWSLGGLMMNCEIEFFAVGSASAAGDAILVRYGDEAAFELMLVDGGHAVTGDEIVTHVKEQFGDGAGLEHVVLTHADGDHACGLRSVIRQLPVANLWLHIPWLLCGQSLHLFADKRWTEAGLSKELESQYSILAEIVDDARAAGVAIHYPFRGSNIGPFTVLSPSPYVYQYLLPQFDKTPEPDREAIEDASMWLGKASLARRLIEGARAAVSGWITEGWNNELLRDGGQTSASNECSVILYGAFDASRRVLLTGDAGVEALTWAADFAEEMGCPLQQFSFVQIPHHGSRRNVGPAILNRIVGPIVAEGLPPKLTAFVSAPVDDAKHPRRMVTNAFVRRGAAVFATQGQSKVHWGGFAPRVGYDSASTLPFHQSVEEYS